MLQRTMNWRAFVAALISLVLSQHSTRCLSETLTCYDCGNGSQSFIVLTNSTGQVTQEFCSAMANNMTSATLGALNIASQQSGAATTTYLHYPYINCTLTVNSTCATALQKTGLSMPIEYPEDHCNALDVPAAGAILGAILTGVLADAGKVAVECALRAAFNITLSSLVDVKLCEKKGTCFPGEATVETPSGLVFMRDLRLGNKVKVVDRHGVATYEKIFMFSHQEHVEEAINTVIKTTESSVLRTTPGHYIWTSVKGVDAKFKAASMKRAADLQVGDMIWSVKNTSTPIAVQIVSISSITMKGIYNPHTASGTIIVDGYAVLTFTDTLPPNSVIHTVLTWPARVFYGIMPSKIVAEYVNAALLSIFL